MDFERDAAKVEENIGKHGVDFAAAARVFLDPYRFEQEDTRFPYGETRFAVIGMVGEQVLVVIYTLRGERIRLISARKAN